MASWSSARALCLATVGVVGLLAGCGRPHAVGSNNWFGTTLVRQDFGGFNLFVSSYGSPPALVAEKCIQGNGLTVRVMNDGSHELWVFDRDEAEDPVRIDYSAANQRRLKITYLTWDPRSPDVEYVDFVEERISFGSDGAARAQRLLLLAGETGSSDDIMRLTDQGVRLLRQINSATQPGDSDPDNDRKWGACLGHLRNIAVFHPEEVEAAFRSMGLRGEAGCGQSEAIGDYLSEVGLIKSCSPSAPVETTLPGRAGPQLTDRDKRARGR